MATKNLTFKERYPLSSTALLVAKDQDLYLNDPKTPTVDNQEMILFQNKFFKSDFEKFLKDNMFFNKITVGLLPALAPIYVGLQERIDYDHRSGEGSGLCREAEKGGACNIVDIDVIKEFEKAIFPYLYLNIAIRDDVLYRNTLASIKENPAVNFMNLGADDMQVTISIDTKYKNYLDLNQIKLFKNDATRYVDKTDGDVFIYDGYRKIQTENQTVMIPLEVKLFGEIIQYKGKIKA